MRKGSSSASKNAASVENRKSGWKGIQLRQKPASRPISVSSQESRQSAVTTGSTEAAPPKPVQEEIPSVPPIPETAGTQKDGTGSGASTPKAGTRSRASSIAASEVFEDAYDDSIPYEIDTSHNSEEAINEVTTTNLSMIYTALQDTASIAEDDFLDDEDVMPAYNPPARAPRDTQQRKWKNLPGWRSSTDVAAEINALEIATHSSAPEQHPSMHSPSFVPPEELVNELTVKGKEPAQEREKEGKEAVGKNDEGNDDTAVKEHDNHPTTAAKDTEPDSATSTEKDEVPDTSPPESSNKKIQQAEKEFSRAAPEQAEPTAVPSLATPTPQPESASTAAVTSSTVPKVAEVETEPATIPVMKEDEDDVEEHAACSMSVSEEPNRLGAILPAMEKSVKEIENDAMLRKQFVDQEEALAKAKRSHEYEYPIEDPIDVDMFKDNEIAVQSVNVKNIPVNNLSPREQEEADEPVREGMRLLFDNKFMKAKAVFQQKSNTDPLYALGLGAMAFIKALMTYNPNDVETAMSALATAYTISKAQIDSASVKRSFKDTFSQYFSSLVSSNNTGLPSSPSSPTRPSRSNGLNGDAPKYLPNGVLRAHVIKAECCLLMGLLQMTKENVVGYIKCGLNLRRAYNSYTVAWQEYKKMGQEYTKYMDRDTVSAIQFGIGSVHLILSSLPPKILKIFSTLGWKSDKQLGFALLKLCLEGKGVRAPLASLMLLSYYSILTSFAPQLYGKELVAPAVECLLEAQKSHPGSCFFLYFAARVARVTKNLPLSTQSFSFAVDSSRGEWAEVPMRHMALYETGWNHALQLDWESAAACFEELSKEKYWSPAFCKYFVGACGEMLGDRTRGILAFAEVPQLAKDQASKSYIDSFVLKKVDFFQKSGYQDMDLMLPGLELLLVWNAFAQMEEGALEKCLSLVQETLDLIYEREKMEYNIRLQELAPSTSPPDYYDQRAILLLTKASILNALERHSESIAHLNWIMDHKDSIKSETWIVPLAYWEAGLTSWGLGNYAKSRKLWQQALACSKYDFEYRMAVRLSVALNKCDEVGVTHVEQKEIKGPSTNGRKRMPIVQS